MNAVLGINPLAASELKSKAPCELAIVRKENEGSCEATVTNKKKLTFLMLFCLSLYDTAILFSSCKLKT